MWREWVEASSSSDVYNCSNDKVGWDESRFNFSKQMDPKLDGKILD